MTLNLFIDTNVLLNFYHFSGEDLEELKKLAALIEQGEIDFWIPQQVCEEFERNRDVKIKDAMKTTTAKIAITAPAFFRNYKQFGELLDVIKEAAKLHSNLMTIVKSDIEKHELAADMTIKSLFNKGKIIERTNEIYARAAERYQIGNPPGKKTNTIGDEINWESLLKAVPRDTDLHIVSVDGDYGSTLVHGAPNSFLSREYNSKKNGNIYLYPSIQEFFPRHFGQIKLATDIAKMKAINNLAKSGSFYSTHLAISALEPFKADLTSEDILKLVEIAETNNQVGWIIADADVSALYLSLAESKEIDEKLKERLFDLFPEPEIEAIQDDDMPF